MNAVFPLSRRPVFGRMAVHIPAMQAFAFRLHRLRGAFSLRKLLDIDFGGLALPLLFPLNQADPLDRVQLCQQLTGFAVAAVQVLLDFIDGVIEKSYSVMTLCSPFSSPLYRLISATRRNINSTP